MQYVVVLEINENEFDFDGDDSIENACRIANHRLAAIDEPITVRPLSEVISA